RAFIRARARAHSRPSRRRCSTGATLLLIAPACYALLTRPWLPVRFMYGVASVAFAFFLCSYQGAPSHALPPLAAHSVAGLQCTKRRYCCRCCPSRC
ncbi:MAG: hypothetical protein ACK4NM_18875, partial [Hydrogenophaga sp.]